MRTCDARPYGLYIRGGAVGADSSSSRCELQPPVTNPFNLVLLTPHPPELRNLLRNLAVAIPLGKGIYSERVSFD